MWPLAASNRIAHGIDVNSAYVEACRSIARHNGMPNIVVEVGSSLAGIAGRRVDAIICIGTLQVVGTGDLWHDFFEAAAQMLRPGGLVLFNIPLPTMALDYHESREAYKYLETEGAEWCEARHRMWLDLYEQGRACVAIERGRRYYSVPRAAAVDLLAVKGLEIAIDADAISSGTDIDDCESYRNPRQGLRHYDWILARKPA